MPPSQIRFGIKDLEGEDSSQTPHDVAEDAEDSERATSALQGWRLAILNTALCLSAFLSTLESTIISTSLVSITNSFGGFRKSSWIVTAYLLTYSGFLIIIAKLSDIFGRKALIQSCLVVFVAFSIGCGAARSLTQLVIMRAFQGIGGGGLYTMVFVILPDMVTSKQYPLYATVLSSVFALSNLLGPIIGGLINNHTSWRWIFYLNAPVGVLTFALILVSLPASFPTRPGAIHQEEKSSTINIRRIDFVGAFLLLAGSVLLVSALEEGGTEYKWKSAVVISLLVVAVSALILFWIWERYQATRETAQESVFPWRMATDRFCMGNLLNSFFVGSAFLAVVINMPQKFQVVLGSSPFQAGYRLLTLTICTPLGSAMAVILTQKLRIPPVYVLLGAAMVQVLGTALLTTVSIHTGSFPAAEYGLEVVLGVGFGLSMGSVVLIAPLVFEKRDMAVGMGAIGQFRVLGGSISLSVCTNILNNHLSVALSPILSAKQLSALLSSAAAIVDIPSSLQDRVREAYADGYQKQMQAITAFSAAAILVTFLMFERKPRWQQSDSVEESKESRSRHK